MPVYINAAATGLNPHVGFRAVTGHGNVTPYEKNLYESTSYFKAVDLLSEGPVEGFCDATGRLVSGSDILKGVYLNDVPVKITTDLAKPDLYNFRSINTVFKHGEESQSGVYTGQGNAGIVDVDNFYWLEDFSYASKTITKNVNLPNSKMLAGNETSVFRTSHSVIDHDVDWIGVTLELGQCSFTENDGWLTGNHGMVHIWGDITGYYHRSTKKILPIPPVSTEYHAYVNFTGVCTSSYKEDILFKLRDPEFGADSSKRSRQIYIRNLTDEPTNFRSKFSARLATVTEITKSNLSYPNSAYVGTVLSAESFSQIPRRTFDLKLKKVKVPSNYEDSGDGPNGPVVEDRHVGVWDGRFKDDLEWTDNPAWILYDLITNDRFGLGEYITDSDINKFELYKIAKYCDQLVPTSKLKKFATNTDPDRFRKERRYSCNVLIQNRMEAYKAIQEIASVFQGMVYFDANKIVITQDNITEPCLKFTNANVKQGDFQYSGTSKQTRFTAIKVAYKDKEENYLPKYAYVEDAEGIIRHGIIEKELAAVGCTSKDQALRLGRWVLLTSNKEEETVSFVTDKIAEHLRPGYVFEVSDSIRNGYKGGGRVKKVVNNKNVASDNYILLDDTVDTNDYNFQSISFNIPGEDLEEQSKQFKTFIHRNGHSIGSADNNLRNFPFTNLDSSASLNPSLNNYIENTPSGAKILTHETQDLILSTGITGDYVNNKLGLGLKTFNDYLLDDSVLSNLRDGANRITNTQKIREGDIYILEGTGDAGYLCGAGVTTKQFKVLSVSSNEDGSYGIVGLEYDQDKFKDVEKLNTIYKESDFELEPTDPPPGDGGPDPNPATPEIIKQPVSFGFPEENTVDLVVRATGFVNTEGVNKSKVEFFFHNTQENGKYYSKGQSNSAGYRIRVQEVTDTYYGNLAATPGVLQDGEYCISGVQDCGEYEVLYDGSDKAVVGGQANKMLSVPNYLDGDFKQDYIIERPRVMNETGKGNLSGCSVFGTKSQDVITGNILSGEFELANPDKYYELRWSEYNSFGQGPEKIMFFRAERDRTPPGACSNFRAKIVFDNIHFNWDNPSDTDLNHARIYTGKHDIAPLYTNGKDDFLIKSSSNFAVYPLDQFNKNRGFGPDLNGSFHIRALDHAGNTGEADNSNDISIMQFGGVDLILSGSVRLGNDGTQNSYITAFYSGDFNDHSDFKEYNLKIQNNTNNETYSRSLPRVDNGGCVTCSGQYDYLAVGGRTYTFRLTSHDIQGNKSAEVSKDLRALNDESPPGQHLWKETNKSSNNIFLSWANPPDNDLDLTILYTGVANDTGVAAGTNIHQISKFQSEVIPLRDFGGDQNKDLYFWLRGVDSSNNTGLFSVGNTDPVTFPGGLLNEVLPHHSGQKLKIQKTTPLRPEHIQLITGIENDTKGDGSSFAYVEYVITGKLNYDHSHYKVDLAKNLGFSPLVGSQLADIEYGINPPTMTGSGVFSNLLANEDYFFRARIKENDGRYSAYTVAKPRPFTTPKDNTNPSNPENFYITSGPKQIFLEWDWPNGADSDLASVVVYKTGIPTGRLNENSTQGKYCWKTQDISGYFDNNKDEYSYILNPGTAFIDSDVETGIFSGYGVGAGDIHDQPRQEVLYHYFLRTVDRSNNTGIGFVSGIASNTHNSYFSDPAKQKTSSFVNQKYGVVPHNLGYVTGGAIDDSYLGNIRASKILTDSITSNTIILANPSGRMVSDNVYAKGLADPKYMYGIGEGLYLDHRMLRIGNPSLGEQGLFWTGEKLGNGDFKQPTWTDIGNGLLGHDIEPNTLEIRGDMTAGSISIGSDPSTQLRIKEDGELSIGNQALRISGYFTGGAGAINQPHIRGNAKPVNVQLNLDDYLPLGKIQFKDKIDALGDAINRGAFLEINYGNGGQDIRGITTSSSYFTYNDGGASPILDYSEGAGLNQNFGYVQLTSPILDYQVDTSWSHVTAGEDRDWWRIVDVRFLVTNDGTLYAQNANIAGTVTANHFEPRQTIILGDEVNPELSVIESFGFRSNENCDVIPSGFQLRGDGTATFWDLTVQSGSISGVSINVGKCDQSNFFRADQEGNISIGPGTVYDDLRNKFHVNNDGDLYAVNAVVSGTISGSAGRIGGLELTENYISTFDVSTSTARNHYTDTDNTGIYIGKDGTFSLANGKGNIIEYAGNNDFVSITGIQSNDFSTSLVGGKARGFYLRGSNAGSFVSNFKTDPASASGIASLIDTQLCGEIPFPLANRTYHIISGSKVNYNILSIDQSAGIGTTAFAACVGGFNPSAGNINIGDDLTVTMPNSTNGATKFCFNIGLSRPDV